jgi:ketosteroid isomerase-like protein
MRTPKLYTADDATWGLLPASMWPTPLPRADNQAGDLAERVEAFYEAAAALDFDRAATLLGPEAAWIEDAGSRSGTPQGGKVITETVFAPLADAVAEFRTDVHELLAYGPVIAVLGTYRGFAIHSSAELAQPFMHIWSFEGATVREVRQYLDAVALQRALGWRAIRP